MSSPNQSPGPGAPLPNDHVRAIIELLRPATPDLGRRWLAALLLVPEAERAAVVEAVEGRIFEQYVHANDDAPAGDVPTAANAAPSLRVVYPPPAQPPAAQTGATGRADRSARAPRRARAR